MDRLEPWVLVWFLTVLLNVVPAFMPPTWALLAYFRLQHGLDLWPLALVGAFGATTGRGLLALASQIVGKRIVPARWQENIHALAATIEDRPAFSLSMFGLLTLGPVPSNHLFIAAGLARASLPPLLAVFAVTRFISYVLWVTAAATATRSLRQVLGPRLGSGLAVALQIAGFLLLILIMQIDWTTHLRRWQRRGRQTAVDSR